MKRFCFLFVLSFLLFSCSKDEVEVEELFYSVSISADCDGVAAEYCVDKSTYDNAVKTMEQSAGDPCVWISFKDVDMENRSGYVKSIDRNSSNPC